MFMKENNCVQYKIQKMPCAIHLSVVKEKEQMKKKRNISLSILFWLSGYQFEKISLTKYSLLEIVPPKFLGVL